MLGIACFAATCVVTQCLRHDLDWIDVPLSFYLLGSWSTGLHVAYVVMAIALILFGAAMYRGLTPSARSSAPLLLFIVAGIALCVVMAEGTNTWAHPNTLHGFVHGVAARTTFLCVTVAMLLQAWRMRLDVRWRSRFAWAFGGAWVCFVGLWVQVLWRDLPRGLSQKVLVLLILTWLVAVAWQASRPVATATPA
ncbi:MAG TPA: DUF998 domain-containing protein [Rhodanobacteraceae bacterium]